MTHTKGAKKPMIYNRHDSAFHIRNILHSNIRFMDYFTHVFDKYDTNIFFFVLTELVFI